MLYVVFHTPLSKYLRCNFNDLELGGFKVDPRSKVMVPIKSPLAVSYLTSIGSSIVSRTIFEIFDAKIMWPTSRRVQGHPRSTLMVPIESPWAVSYPTSFESNVVSLTVFEIFDAKILWPRSRTVQGHPGSKVMVPDTQTDFIICPLLLMHWADKKKRSADDFQTFLMEYLQEKAKREQREEERKEEWRQQFELEKAKLDLLSKILKEQ